MAARGGQVGMGPRPGANRGKPLREEEEEERMERVCFYRGGRAGLVAVGGDGGGRAGGAAGGAGGGVGRGNNIWQILHEKKVSQIQSLD